MSYNQYGGNPYGSTGESGYNSANRVEGGYGSSNPYGNDGGYGSSNPYGAQPQQQGGYNRPAIQQETSNYSQQEYSSTREYSSQQQSGVSPPPAVVVAGSEPLKREEFLNRINDAKARINELTGNIQEIAQLHQRMISSPDNSASNRLENLVTRTQILNTNIKDEIKFLEKDALRSQGDTLKNSQVKNLKGTFQRQLQDYQRQENEYEKRYRDAIARQYRIVNPDATDAEVTEAANANWGNEGVFQTALKSNRLGQASSVLGAVRARHNDIVQIEKAMTELALLFQQLDEQVQLQEPMVNQITEQTETVKNDTDVANVHLDKGIASARRARKLKWICVAIVFIIILALGLGLGIYFGVVQRNNNNNNNNNNQN